MFYLLTKLNTSSYLWENIRFSYIQKGNKLFNISLEGLANAVRQGKNRRYTSWEGRNKDDMIHRWHDCLT